MNKLVYGIPGRIKANSMLFPLTLRKKRLFMCFGILTGQMKTKTSDQIFKILLARLSSVSFNELAHNLSQLNR
jgi:hypothetical protein